MPRVANGDVRQKILNAAEYRLWHYGFKKTTIDEIAADAGVGKGTVYLYFDSKEDIALAIMTHFKVANLDEMKRIAGARQNNSVDRLKKLLSYPLVMAYERCSQSPSALEMIIAVRPHIQATLKPYQDQETALIAQVIEEGNEDGVFSVGDPAHAARTLRTMCAGFRPPYPLVEGAEAIQSEISQIIDLVFRGLCHPKEKVKCGFLGETISAKE